MCCASSMGPPTSAACRVIAGEVPVVCDCNMRLTDERPIFFISDRGHKEISLRSPWLVLTARHQRRAAAPAAHIRHSLHRGENSWQRRRMTSIGRRW